MSFLQKLVKSAAHKASQVYDQANVFDNGLSYQTRQVNPNVPQRSVVQQAANVGYNTVKPVVQVPVQFAENYANTFANLGNRLGGGHNMTIQQNMGGSQALNKTLKFSNATGQGKQLAGDVAQIGLSTLPGVGQGAKLAFKVAGGSALGAGFNAAATAGDGGTKKDIIKSAVIGGALGGAIPALPAVARGSATLSKKGVKTAAGAVNEARGKTFNGLPKQQIITDINHLKALDSFQEGVYDQKPLTSHHQQEVINQLHDIKNKHGLDFISGSPKDRADRIADYRQQWDTSLQKYQDHLMKPSLATDEAGAIGRNIRQNPNNLRKELGQVSNQMKATQGTPKWESFAQKADQIAQMLDEADIGHYQARNGVKPPSRRSLVDNAALKAKGMLTPLDEVGGGAVENSPIRKALQDEVNPKVTSIKKQMDAINRQGIVKHDVAGEPYAVHSESNQIKLNKLQDRLDKIQPPASVTGASKTEPLVDVNKYIKQQSKVQENARNAGKPAGLNKLSAAKSDLKTKFLDSFAPVEDTLNQAIKDGAHIDPEHNIKYQIDRAIRGDTIGAQYIKDGGLAKIIQDVPNTKEFDQYLIARHAPDLEALGIKTGRDLNADRQLVQALGAKYEPYAQAINQYSQKLLDTATDYGLISKDLAAHLKEKYPNYVPVNRIFSEEEQQIFKGNGSGKASISNQTVVQRIKGSERQIESPLSSLVDKSVSVVQQGERNRAAQILTGYRDLPGNPFQLRELAKDEAVGQKPVISVLENGETRQFETSPEVAAAAKSLNKEQLGLIGKILAVPTRVLRLGATGLNVGFTGANVAKDLASGFINSKHPLSASILNPDVFVKALKASVNHGSSEYGELVRQGAGGTSFDIARNAPVENIRQIRAQKNGVSKAMYTVTTPSQLLRAAENAIGRSEEFNRAIQYYGNKQAFLKETGSMSRAQILAADAARNNTVNFARAGDYGRVLNSVFPYLNAGIQGSRTLLRNVKDRPVQTGTKIALVGFFPTAAITAWNTSDPQRKAAYDDIKEYEKQGNMIIVPPHPVKDPKTGRWNVIKIPVSQEIANLNNIVRNGVEAGVHDGSIKLADLVGNAVGTITSLNAQSPRQLAGQATPQAVKPVVETVFNQNLFTGNKIVPDSQKELSPRDQYGDYTSGTAKVLGRTLNLSPPQIDNFVRTSTGGVGQNVINTTDRLLAKTGVIKPNEVQGKSLEQSITNRFSGAQGMSDYDKADQQNKKVSTALKQLPGYKNMSPADKAKALNRVKSDVSKTFLPPKDGKAITLSKRQIGLASGKPDLNSYLTAQKAGSSKPSKTDPTSDLYKSNDAEYKQLKSDYDKKIKEGKLSTAAQIKAETALNKAKVGASYPKTVRDLYGLSKAQLYQYVSTNPDGQKLAEQVVAYGDALKDAGVNSYNKFRNTKSGAVSIAPTAKKASSGRKLTGSKKAAKYSLSKYSNSGAIAMTKSVSGKVRSSTVKSPSSNRKVTFNSKIKQSKTYKLAKISKGRTA